MKFDTDPKFSVIIPVYDVPEDVFKRCLLSVADQDYTNLEVIIVPNGGDEKAEKMAKAFAKGRKDWKVYPLKEKGACQARNYGFSKSTGEIVSFTNSDYILKIGCVRMWVDQLLAHPECGFVYGDYEYRTAKKYVFQSKAFNVFELEQENYIDCGFPLWRQHIVEWDPEVKSLQDWDFWLRVVKKGIKGHFLGREISFIAELPRAKGLSHDSSSNWIERVKFVKEKNGIPLHDICVVSYGAKNHAVKIAQMIGADYRDVTLHQDHKYKALYLIGWYMKPGFDDNPHAGLVNSFRAKGSKIIVHFVGADIYWLRKFSVQVIKEWAGAMRMACDHILCENEGAQRELKGYGIDASIVPIPPYTDLGVTPLPEEFSVALYLTDKSDFDKYLQKHTLSLVKAMPDVQFKGYGDGAEDFKAPNFKHVGTLTTEEWAQFVKDTSAYVRLVNHDTRPMASDEFIMAGRSVITNIPNEHMDVVVTAGDLPFDEWDAFAPGFSTMRWPETKKKIIQMIRHVRDREPNQIQREFASHELKNLLNKEKYERTIKELSYSPIKEMVKA